MTIGSVDSTSTSSAPPTFVSKKGGISAINFYSLTKNFEDSTRSLSESPRISKIFPTNSETCSLESIPKSTVSRVNSEKKVVITPRRKKNTGSTEHKINVLFLNSIRNFEKEKAKQSLKLQKVKESERDQFILDRIHKKNCITTFEAPLAFKAFMSTENYIRIIKERFVKKKSFEKKFDCLLMFKGIFELGNFYRSDFIENIALGAHKKKESNALTAAQKFIKKVRDSEFGKTALSKEEGMLIEFSSQKSDELLKNSYLEESSSAISESITPESVPVKVETINEFYDYLNNDVEIIGQEFLTLTIELQAMLDSNIFDPEIFNKTPLVSTISNNLTNAIINDIRASKQAIGFGKFGWYVHLGKIVMHTKNIFICQVICAALANTLISDYFGGQEKIKKWDTDIQALTNFCFSSEGKYLRDEILKDKKNPLNVLSLLWKINNLKENYGLQKDRASFSDYLVNLGYLAKDLTDRQKIANEKVNKRNFIVDLIDLFSKNIELK